MNHPEVDELLDLVRGDSPDEDVRRHVDGCDLCTAGMERVVRLDRAAGVSGREAGARRLLSPPDSVWERIQDELASPDPVRPARPERARPRRRVLTAAAAAVAGIVLGGVGGYVVADRDDGSSSPDRPSVVAQAPLATGTLIPVGQHVESGEMAMSGVDGSLSLTITLSQPVAGPGYVEAWLLDPSTNEMLGLGVLGPSGGTVTVPADADLTRFTTVDISREPVDGDPAHSADSIARGLLRQA
jgi:hypothetical protein